MLDRLKIYPNYSRKETRVEVSWTSNLDSKEYVSMTVYPGGINVAATGTLNVDGIEAFNTAMNVSLAIFKHGLDVL